MLMSLSQLLWKVHKNVFKLVVWVACGNEDSVLKLLGCVVSLFVGVSNLSHVEPNFTFDVHFILYDNC